MPRFFPVSSIRQVSRLEPHVSRTHSRSHNCQPQVYLILLRSPLGRARPDPLPTFRNGACSTTTSWERPSASACQILCSISPSTLLRKVHRHHAASDTKRREAHSDSGVRTAETRRRATATRSTIWSPYTFTTAAIDITSSCRAIHTNALDNDSSIRVPNTTASLSSQSLPPLPRPIHRPLARCQDRPAPASRPRETRQSPQS